MKKLSLRMLGIKQYLITVRLITTEKIYSDFIANSIIALKKNHWQINSNQN